MTPDKQSNINQKRDAYFQTSALLDQANGNEASTANLASVAQTYATVGVLVDLQKVTDKANSDLAIAVANAAKAKQAAIDATAADGAAYADFQAAIVASKQTSAVEQP